MYKVFVNDKPIIFTTSLKNEENYAVFAYRNLNLEELIFKLKEDKLNGFYLYSFDLVKDWKSFKTKFKVVKAAGGLVVNKGKEILFIYRKDKWDLPKGKIKKKEEVKETAIREVEEECGVKNITIEKKLIVTYHFFIKKGTYRLKETHWYLMSSLYEGKLIPQQEEGITKVVYKNIEDINIAFQNTFLNIVLVVESYKK